VNKEDGDRITTKMKTREQKVLSVEICGGTTLVMIA
jgi:hypothetical protein